MPRPTIFEPLSPQHDVSQFNCGGKLASPEINAFLREKALNEQRNRASTTHILRLDGETAIRAYITTAMGSVRGVPGWEMPVPGLHIAYVGSDQSVKGGGWGRHLINWALRFGEQSHGCRCIHLFAYADMVDYYTRLGFFPHGKPMADPTGPKQLMIFDILAAIRDAEGQPIAPMARNLPN